MPPHSTPPAVPRLAASLSPSRSAARCARAVALALACTAGLGLQAAPRDATALDETELSPAQSLIYDAPHLKNVAAGEELGYVWTADHPPAADPTAPAAGAPVSDRATLEVTAARDDGSRDVTLDFLTGERKLDLPPFEGWHGNPVLLAVFERFAEDFAIQAGGGGSLYFRNRMREALADKRTSMQDVSADWRGERVPATRIDVVPFENDAYLGKRPGLGDAKISLVLSEAVPGGVLSATVQSAGDGATPYRRELRLDTDTLKL